jgi:hypothetical protein
MPMGIRKVRDVTGVPIDDLRATDDPIAAVKGLYGFGRSYPNGKPTQKDYAPRRGPADRQPPQPGFDEYRATYRPARNSDVSPAPDESASQFVSDKVASHDDVPLSDWTRGGAIAAILTSIIPRLAVRSANSHERLVC